MLFEQSLSLLQKLIATPSFSREEQATANLIAHFFEAKGIVPQRIANNICVRNKHFDRNKPCVLLNSHHDTVRPVAGWTLDPFEPLIKDGKLYGLGSNDAGASLVALAATFLHFYQQEDLAFNLLFAATAEEEISGPAGIALMLPELPPIAFGIVGEPTKMQMAVAEKGLMVVDAMAKGVAGHAARDEGTNALYIALDDIARLRDMDLGEPPSLLGKTKLTVTQITAGTQHNVVPDTCQFVIDIRTNEHQDNRQLLEFLQTKVQSTLKARSFRLGSSSIPLDHPLVLRGLALGLQPFGSPTLSDQALMPFPTLKIGCGDSARSHTADEYIFVEEIKAGIATYVQLLKGIL